MLGTPAKTVECYVVGCDRQTRAVARRGSEVHPGVRICGPCLTKVRRRGWRPTLARPSSEVAD